MNVSECCKTIGCNCGGTMMAELMGSLKWYDWIILIFVMGIILSIIFLALKHLQKLKNSIP